MEVPQHLSAFGDVKSDVGTVKYPLDGLSFAQEMNVPERIIVAGGDRTVGDRGTPTELLVENLAPPNPVQLSTPPTSLTLDKAAYPDIEETPPRSRNALLDESMSQGSIAVEENPIRELKLMRRQLARLSTRVYQLEDANERRKNRDSLLLVSFVVMSGALIALIFRRGTI